MKKSYNSPKVVITAFTSANVTSLNYISAVQAPVKTETFNKSGLIIHS